MALKVEKQSLLPTIEVKGNYHDMGVQIGKSFKERIITTLSNLPSFQTHKKMDDKDPTRVNFVLEQAQKQFPDYVNHLRGISVGSGLSYREILIHNFMHMPDIANCSTGIVFPNSGEISLCHNEDSHPTLGAHSYFVKYHFENNLKIVAHSYPGIIPGISFGFNSHGIFMSTNSLPDPFHQMGVSRVFFGFHALHQPTIDKAVQVVQEYTPRMGGANYNFISLPEKKVINVETSSIAARTTKVTDSFFHTNHFIHQDFAIYPIGSKNTVSRLINGNWHLKSSDSSPENLLSIMRSKGIFLDQEETGYEYQTNGILLVSAKDDLTLTYYPRDESSSKYQTFTLQELVH